MAPIKDWNDRVLGAVVIASTSETIEAIVAEERIKILWLMLAALAISITLSATLAHYIAWPLSRLVSEANAITERRVALAEESLQVFWSLASYRSEIGTLALAHGKMVDSLRKRILQIKNDADTLAHRTGTKLSIVLTEAHNLLTRDSQQIPGASLTGSQREYIQNMLSAAQEASDTVNLILSQAVRDADAERSQREYSDLAEVVTEIVSEFSEEVRRSQVSLQLTGGNPGQQSYLGHPSQVQEVLRELLSNAVSFTPPGGEVRVNLHIHGDRTSDTSERFPVKLSVENEGDPIPEMIFPVIFEPGKTVRRGSGSHNGWGPLDSEADTGIDRWRHPGGKHHPGGRPECRALHRAPAMMPDRAGEGPPDTGIGVVIVGHDGLAQALRATLEHIMGPVPRIAAIGVSDADDELSARVIEATQQVDAGMGVVIAADMHGSSPCNLALQAAREAGIPVEVAAGANLPMLVALVENRALPPLEAAETALRQAKRCLLRSTGGRRDHDCG